MKKVLATSVAATTIAALLIGCNPVEACAKPGGGSKGSSGSSVSKPANQQPRHSIPKSKPTKIGDHDIDIEFDNSGEVC